MGGPIEKFQKSFMNAARGIGFLYKSQLNARIEFLVAGIAIVTGFLLKINSGEWLIILLCIALVLGLEGINTAIEFFADKLHPDFDAQIGKVKDVAAGSVLIAAIVAAIVGFIIFAPKFLILFTN